ncbi:MAG: carbohydrate kinase family protein [Microbacteriaceae bacterium]
MSRAPRVVAAGHICVDLTPGLRAAPSGAPGALIDVGPLATRVGGCVGNTALALARLGVEVQAQAVVGDDALGTIARADLQRAGIGAEGVVAAPLATSYSVVIEPPGVDRTFWHHTGANELFDGARVVLDGADALHVGYPSLLPALVDDAGAPFAALLRRAKAAGATTSVDLAVVDPAGPAGAVQWDRVLAAVGEHLDVVTPSYDDLASMWRDASEWSIGTERAYARRLLDHGVAVVAISAGSRGLAVYTADRERLRRAGGPLASRAESWADRAFRHEVPAVVRPRSTNGAGDASTAGFLAALLRGDDPRQAAERAARSARAVLCGEGDTSPAAGPGRG